VVALRDQKHSFLSPCVFSNGSISDWIRRWAVVAARACDTLCRVPTPAPSQGRYSICHARSFLLHAVSFPRHGRRRCGRPQLPLHSFKSQIANKMKAHYMRYQTGNSRQPAWLARTGPDFSTSATVFPQRHDKGERLSFGRYAHAGARPHGWQRQKKRAFRADERISCTPTADTATAPQTSGSNVRTRAGSHSCGRTCR
jgi:hypothetical protein